MFCYYLESRTSSEHKWISAKTGTRGRFLTCFDFRKGRGEGVLLSAHKGCIQKGSTGTWPSPGHLDHYDSVSKNTLSNEFELLRHGVIWKYPMVHIVYLQITLWCKNSNSYHFWIHHGPWCGSEEGLLQIPWDTRKSYEKMRFTYEQQFCILNCWWFFHKKFSFLLPSFFSPQGSVHN